MANRSMIDMIQFICNWLCQNISVENVISIFAIIAPSIFGVIAICQTNKSIVNSNKQDLFDKRFDIYCLINKINELCQNNLHLFEMNKQDHKKYYAVDFMAACLTNSAELSLLSYAFYEFDEITQNKFLTKLEDIRFEAVKSKMLFPNEFDVISKYINDYVDLIMSMYEYCRFLKSVRELADSLPKYIVPSEQEKLLNGDLEKEIHNKIDNYIWNIQELQLQYKHMAPKLEEFMKLNKVR